MISFIKSLKNHTFVKYLFSYLLLSSILLIGFLFIIKNQLTDRFYEQRSEQLQVQLDNTQEWLTEYFKTLTTLNNSLQDTLSPIFATYKTEASRNYAISQELTKYDNSSTLISSIAYKPQNSSTVISTKHFITYTNNEFYIKNTTLAGTDFDDIVIFDPSAYLNAGSEQFILIQKESLRYLLYFPDTKSIDGSIYFFILDINEIEQHLNTLLSNEIPTVALVDANKQPITDINSELLAPYMDSLQLIDGNYAPVSSINIYIKTGVKRELSLIALMSKKVLSAQINDVFSTSYLLLLLLCITSIFLTLYSMRITYLPLKQLSARFLPELATSQNHIKELESTFDKTIKQNQAMEQKLINYRNFMQKSLFDTLATPSSRPEMSSFFLDSFFDSNIRREIFITCIMSPTEKLPCQSIKTFFQRVLPGNDSCVILDSSLNCATFLINYTGMEPNKSEVIKTLLYNYYEKEGYLSALSISTDSPLNIPSLYQNVIEATNYWPETPVVEHTVVSSSTSLYDYPHIQLKQLSVSLDEQNFSQAKELIADIIRLVNRTYETNEKMQAFFSTSIFLDMLTTIAISMNRVQIDFSFFENIYNETLFYCRSCSYTKVASEIETNFFRLIEIYEDSYSGKALSLSQVIQFMQENYSDPDFSITLLADKCHVSIAYMSFLLKKELKQNFSDYLWTLRLSKASDFLANTDMSIEEISIAIGYLNPSSFYRKFKKETGLTPSQFRANMHHK